MNEGPTVSIGLLLAWFGSWPRPTNLLGGMMADEAQDGTVCRGGQGGSRTFTISIAGRRAELLSFEGFALWFHAAVGNHTIGSRWTATVQWCPFGEAVAGPPSVFCLGIHLEDAGSLRDGRGGLRILEICISDAAALLISLL